MRNTVAAVLVGTVLLGMLPGCVVPRDWREDVTICPVHSVKLKTETTQIVYGTLGWREGYLEAEAKLFPHSNSVARGGCTSGLFSPVFARIRYCPACRVAEAARLAEHPWLPSVILRDEATVGVDCPHELPPRS
jgi:hypothetical protein